MMKKSAMRALLEKAGVRLEGGDAVLREMEDKGQVWEPEDESLPERLVIAGCEAGPAGEVYPLRFCAFEARNHGGVFSTRELKRRIFAEAVRRYNLVPSVRTIVEQGIARTPIYYESPLRDILRLIDSKETI